MNTYYVFRTYMESVFFKFEEVEVLLSFLLMASAILQLGWCAYLAQAVLPSFSWDGELTWHVPESQFIEEKED